MKEKLHEEKKKIFKLQEEKTKAQEENDKNKNSIFSEIFKKDECINSLSLQVNELKAVIRQNETKEYEKKLKA